MKPPDGMQEDLDAFMLERGAGRKLIGFDEAKAHVVEWLETRSPAFDGGWLRDHWLGSADEEASP